MSGADAFGYYPAATGQLISKCPFGIFKSTKKTNKSFVRIPALAYKKGQITKTRARYTANRMILFWLLFWFDLFLEVGQKSLQKFRWFFLVYLKIPKGHFEINWPLKRQNGRFVDQIISCQISINGIVLPISICFLCGLQWMKDLSYFISKKGCYVGPFIVNFTCNYRLSQRSCN